MEFMNDFVEREWQHMEDFLNKISRRSSVRNTTEVIIDLGKELSLLHSYLEETWTLEVADKAFSSDPRVGDLLDILSDLSHVRHRGRMNDMMTSSNMMNTSTLSTSSDYDNSIDRTPRGANENLPAYRATPPTGHAHLMTAGQSPSTPGSASSLRVCPAPHLNTADDYVLSTAFIMNNDQARRLPRSSHQSTSSSSSASSPGMAYHPRGGATVTMGTSSLHRC